MTVTVATNGEEALQLLEAYSVDGILMDCQMPVMDGYTATRRIRRHDHFRHLPIIAMTANVMAREREKVFDAGMNDHIAKPINIREMFRTMARWITPGTPVPADDVAGKGMLSRENAEPATDDPLRDIVGLDVKDALTRVQGNRGLYVKLLRRLATEHDADMVEFDAAAANGDWTSAMRIAHTIKGLAGTVGAGDLQERFARLESEARRQRLDEEVRDAADDELARIIGEIRRRLQEEDHEPDRAGEVPDPEGVDVARLVRVLEELTELVSGFFATAEDRLAEERTVFVNAGYGDAASQLETALGEFDFDHAGSILSTVREDVARDFQTPPSAQ